MREIKFRVWDIDHKQFLPKETYDIHSRTSFGSFGVMRKDWKNYRKGEYFYDNFQVLEQFTGLEYKNGVDIYEGDYICLDGLKTHRWNICYSGSGFIASPLRGNSLVEYRTLQNNNYLQFEVIGNIHENKLD